MPQIKDLLINAFIPLGSTLYVWGGGWNKADDGAGGSAVSIGASPKWEKFFDGQDESYDFKKHRYEIENGLDCSGYVGWTVYNTLRRENGGEGFVFPARTAARQFSKFGWGEYTPADSVRDIRAGDILSSDSHVIIALGECRDKSAAFIHCGPPGVQISGTADGAAAELCNMYMKRLCPKWCERFPDSSRGADYLRGFSRMRWNTSGGVLSDEDGLCEMCAEDVLKIMSKLQIKHGF